MLFRSIVLLCTFTFLSPAIAQDDAAPAVDTGSAAGTFTSEYLHQAPAGKFEVTPGLVIQSAKAKLKNAVEEPTTALVALIAKAEYGFSDMFSLAAQLGLGVGGTSYDNCPTGTTCNDTVAKGMIDPILTANGRIPLGSGALRFGADLSVSLEKSKYEADGDSNLATGGTVLEPFAGYEMTIGSNVFGGKVSYEAYKSDRDVKNDSTTPPSTFKITGEQETKVNLFYEYHFPRIVSIGSALEYTNSPASKNESAGVSTSNDDAADIVMGKIYVPLVFNSHVTLVPSLSVGSTDYRSSATTIKEQTNTELTVIGRFTF